MSVGSPPVSGSSADPCGCPAGFSRCAGRCLALLPEQVSFPEAEALCKKQKARLAVPRSEAENNCTLALAGGRSVWLGVNDRLEDLVWEAADGECGEVPASAAWWAQDEPTAQTGEGCVFMDLGGWADAYCNHQRYQLHPMCQYSNCLQPQCP